MTITMRNERGDEETISDVIANQRDSPYMVMKAYEIKLGWRPVEVEVVEVVSAGGIKITEAGKQE